ncbi:MAG: hypothetical protein A3A82_00455 [Candidatus Pacebacteria bacterium RIFCSPLOWO2_01_FULL_47_12]|nr:MAG: hypothetical protein A3A82_00455 [Candidatus Pacebacteria bacterium RIFCSPLOWO2_01_FULL_47_12]
MQRYQVYFEPNTMDTLRAIGQASGFSRSHLLQELADILATRYQSFIKIEESKMGNLLKLSGIITTDSGKTTHSSTKPDSEYFGV